MGRSCEAFGLEEILEEKEARLGPWCEDKEAGRGWGEAWSEPSRLVPQRQHVHPYLWDTVGTAECPRSGQSRTPTTGPGHWS